MTTKMLALLSALLLLAGCLLPAAEPPDAAPPEEGEESLIVSGVSGVSGLRLLCWSAASCPQPASDSCMVAVCGALTAVGMPPGCSWQYVPPGTPCSYQQGIYTCPGACSGGSTNECVPTETHCGGYY